MKHFFAGNATIFKDSDDGAPYIMVVNNTEEKILARPYVRLYVDTSTSAHSNVDKYIDKQSTGIITWREMFNTKYDDKNTLTYCDFLPKNIITNSFDYRYSYKVEVINSEDDSVEKTYYTNWFDQDNYTQFTEQSDAEYKVAKNKYIKIEVKYPKNGVYSMDEAYSSNGYGSNEYALTLTDNYGEMNYWDDDRMDFNIVKKGFIGSIAVGTEQSYEYSIDNSDSKINSITFRVYEDGNVKEYTLDQANPFVEGDAFTSDPTSVVICVTKIDYEE